MKFKELAALCGLQSPENNLNVTNYAFHSDFIKPGGVFFALFGNKVDGHHFLKRAANNGAVAAIVSKKYTGNSFGMALIYVDDVLQTLQLLARKKVETIQAKFIGITGSMGKTTTKEFLACLLSERYKVFKTPKSYNTQISFPITLLNESEAPDIFVLEMGMSGKGHIQQLVSIAPPHISLVTHITHAHFAFFSSLEEISEAKAEIFTSERLEHKVASVQAMNFPAIAQTGNVPTTVYGRDTKLEMKGELIRCRDFDGFSSWFSAPFKESHLLENMLGAITIARLLNLSWAEIIAKVKELQTPACRFEKIHADGSIYINDSYNANVDSTLAALNNLPPKTPHAKTIFVFGEMKELGTFTWQAHEIVANHALQLVDICLCIGEETKRIVQLFNDHGKPGEHFEKVSDLQKRLSQIVQKEDVILIKGANSFKLWEIIPK